MYKILFHGWFQWKGCGSQELTLEERGQQTRLNQKLSVEQIAKIALYYMTIIVITRIILLLIITIITATIMTTIITTVLIFAMIITSIIAPNLQANGAVCGGSTLR